MKKDKQSSEISGKEKLAALELGIVGRREWVQLKKSLKPEELTDTKACESAAKSLRKEIESEINQAIPPGKEMKLTKAYLAWLNEDKPKGDERQKAYEEMETVIAKLKAEYQPLKEAIKKRREVLEQEENKKSRKK